MEKALKIMSWIAVAIGVCAILSGISERGDDGFNALLGGALFLAQGWLALSYMAKYK